MPLHLVWSVSQYGIFPAGFQPGGSRTLGPSTRQNSRGKKSESVPATSTKFTWSLRMMWMRRGPNSKKISRSHDDSDVGALQNYTFGVAVGAQRISFKPMQQG